MVDSAEIIARRDIAIKATKQAGRLLASRFGRIKNIKEKGDRDLVTDIDVAAENIVKHQIIKNFPKDNIISEERPVRQRSEFSWIIDPLDGTHNYIHNIGIFGVSVALAYRENVVVGVIYMPLCNELYVAGEGKGAFCNGKKISVSNRPIREATLVFDSSIRYQKKRMQKDLGRLVDKVFNVRMFGSTVQGLVYVAAGKAEAEIEYNDKVWDFAAGLLLVEEAGGQATDLQGKKWNIHSKGYVASNRKIHNQILRLI